MWDMMIKIFKNKKVVSMALSAMIFISACGGHSRTSEKRVGSFPLLCAGVGIVGLTTLCKLIKYFRRDNPKQISNNDNDNSEVSGYNDEKNKDYENTHNKKDYEQIYNQLSEIDDEDLAEQEACIINDNKNKKTNTDKVKSSNVGSTIQKGIGNVSNIKTHAVADESDDNDNYKQMDNETDDDDDSKKNYSVEQEYEKKFITENLQQLEKIKLQDNSEIKKIIKEIIKEILNNDLFKNWQKTTGYSSEKKISLRDRLKLLFLLEEKLDRIKNVIEKKELKLKKEELVIISDCERITEKIKNKIKNHLLYNSRYNNVNQLDPRDIMTKYNNVHMQSRKNFAKVLKKIYMDNKEESKSQAKRHVNEDIIFIFYELLKSLKINIKSDFEEDMPDNLTNRWLSNTKCKKAIENFFNIDYTNYNKDKVYKEGVNFVYKEIKLRYYREYSSHKSDIVGKSVLKIKRLFKERYRDIYNTELKKLLDTFSEELSNCLFDFIITLPSVEFKQGTLGDKYDNNLHEYAVGSNEIEDEAVLKYTLWPSVIKKDNSATLSRILAFFE